MEARLDIVRRYRQARRPQSRSSRPHTAIFANCSREGRPGTLLLEPDWVFPKRLGITIRLSSSFTLGGYRDANEGYVATELRKAGFATLTYDSFAARGTTGAALQGSSGYLPPGVADAYAALRLLSGEPRIDPDRIAIIGFSYGAEVAH